MTLTPLIDPVDSTYDQAGNRKTAADTSGDWVYNNNNQLLSYTGVRFSYDENGSVVSKSQNEKITTYVYDLENRLSAVKNYSNATIAEYYYDPMGRRLWKDVGGQRTYFVYSDEGLVAEADASGAIKQSYGWTPESFWSTDPLFTKTATGYGYYLNDHLGTPQKLINSSGAIQWSAWYSAFGKAGIGAAQINNNLRFPGQYFDAETGLHYNYFRDYDPGTGRYVRSDPIGVLGLLNGAADEVAKDITQQPFVAAIKQSQIGYSGLSAFGKNINTYAYVTNNPLRYIDPFGLDRYDICKDYGDIGGSICRGCVGAVCGIPGIDKVCCKIDFDDCVGESGGDIDEMAVCTAKFNACNLSKSKKLPSRPNSGDSCGGCI